MAQVTLYLDDQTAAHMRRAAKAAGVSQSRWLADIVRQQAAARWPEAVKRLAGAWPDFESAEALRRRPGRDVRRARF